MSLFTVALDDELRDHLRRAVAVYEAERRRNGLYGLPAVVADFRRSVLLDDATDSQEGTDTGGLVVGGDDALYVGSAAAANLLGVSRRTLSRRIADGSVPSVVLGGRRLIRRSDIERI